MSYSDVLYFTLVMLGCNFFWYVPYLKCNHTNLFVKNEEVSGDLNFY